MSVQSLLLISAAVMLAAFVQGATGVGFALIVAPVVGLFEPRLLPVCLLALMVPLNLYVLWRERSRVDRSGAGWITAGRLAGTAGGLWVLVALSPGQLSTFVGVATLAAAVASLLAPAFTPARPAYLASGLVTGITETATGIGGPPLALVYQHQPPPVMRSTVALCFLVGELVSLAVLGATHQVQAQHLTAAMQLLPPLLLGVLLSRAVHHRIDTRVLRGFVLVFAIVSGVVLLLR
ncbi:MAG: sulfite exporter TauE/SafE family protein [Betaproteobacteria bacterium]|nr:MAG: sulfite exporter TauE/SafE family protein [Betaproteobacteria bacterium]